MIVLGLEGWLHPGKWPWGLLPISLVAAVVAVIPLVVKRRRTVENREKKAAREAYLRDQSGQGG